MDKSPRELDDDELIARLHDETNKVRPGYPAEHGGPALLGDPDVDLDVAGVEKQDEAE